MTKPTEQDIYKALSRVKDPELNRDLVSLNMVRDVRVDGGEVSLKVFLTTPACPLRDRIEADERGGDGGARRRVRIGGDGRRGEGRRRPAGPAAG